MRGLIRFLIRWIGLLCAPGGMLWALSPLGVHLSDIKFKTPDVFWKLFPTAPLLILIGLIGLQLRQPERSGLLQKIGFFAAAIGLCLVIAGDFGLYWLHLDNTYIMTAPAWRTFRLGLILLAVGSMLFGVFAPRDGALPTWGLLPFVIGSFCGLISFVHDFGTLGAILWMIFGAGWVWLAFSLFVHGVLSFRRKKRAASPPAPKPLQSSAVTSGRDFESEKSGARQENISDGGPTAEQVDEPVGPNEDDSYVAKVARGAGISTAGQGVGRVIGYVTQVVIARLLGAQFYGFYTAGVALINGLQIVSRFGMENGVVRYVAHHREHNDAARVRGTIVMALLFPIALSIILSAVLFFGAGFLADSGWLKENGAMMVGVLRGFAFVLPFFVFMSMTAWATQGFQTVTYAAYIQQLIRPGLFLIFVGVCYVLGAKVFGVIAAYAIAMLLAGLVGLSYLWKLFPDLFNRRAETRFETKAIFGVSIPMSVTQGAQYLNNFSAILILTVFAAGPPVGIFNAAARTATFLTAVRFAFSGIFSPIISGLYARQDMEEMSRLYKDVSRWIFTGAFALFLVIVVFGPEVMGIFGEAFGAGVTALVIVAVAQLYSSSVGPAPRMLAMTENQNYAMIATSVAAATGVIVGFILIPRFEVLGAAIAMATAIIVENTGTMAAVKWRLGYWPFNVTWLKPLTAGAVAAIVTYLLKITLPLDAIFGFLPVPVSIPTIMFLGGFLVILFFGLLWLFGFSETDREFIGTFWKVAQRALQRVRRAGGVGEARG